METESPREAGRRVPIGFANAVEQFMCPIQSVGDVRGPDAMIIIDRYDKRRLDTAGQGADNECYHGRRSGGLGSRIIPCPRQ